MFEWVKTHSWTAPSLGFTSFCLLVFLVCQHFTFLNHFKMIRCIVKPLIATSTFFCWNTSEKRVHKKCFSSTTVWLPKLVYWSRKWPDYVTGHIQKSSCMVILTNLLLFKQQDLQIIGFNPLLAIISNTVLFLCV